MNKNTSEPRICTFFSGICPRTRCYTAMTLNLVNNKKFELTAADSLSLNLLMGKPCWSKLRMMKTECVVHKILNKLMQRCLLSLLHSMKSELYQ